MVLDCCSSRGNSQRGRQKRRVDLRSVCVHHEIELVFSARLAAPLDVEPEEVQPVAEVPHTGLGRWQPQPMVPGLRCREDPLPQPPYAILVGTPIHGIPLQTIVLGSVRPGPARKCWDYDPFVTHPIAGSWSASGAWTATLRGFPT
jgi:hypothetical protein